jgi:uncharacterized protein (TIGR00725 family)
VVPDAYVAVVGDGRDDAPPSVLDAAELLGARVAEHGWLLVTGGRGGVMEAACRGAKSRRGTTLGLLPGLARADANGWVDIALPTGLGELRNGLVVRAADVVLAVGGGHGTLSEIALALKLERPVIGLGSWAVDGVEEAAGPDDAIQRVVRLLS